MDRLFTQVCRTGWLSTFTEGQSVSYDKNWRTLRRHVTLIHHTVQWPTTEVARALVSRERGVSNQLNTILYMFCFCNLKKLLHEYL